MMTIYKLKIVVDIMADSEMSDMVVEINIDTQSIDPTVTLYEWIGFMVEKFEKEFGVVVEVNLSYEYGVEE